MNGNITVASEEGKGSTFKFEIPLTDYSKENAEIKISDESFENHSSDDDEIVL